MNTITEITKAFNAIGYSGDNLINNYEFNNFLQNDNNITKLDLAVFAQKPFDYYSACFGVKLLDPSINLQNYAEDIRAFGAPLSIFISNGKSEIWRNGRDNTFKYLEIATSQISHYLLENRNSFEPQSLMRSKIGSQVTSIQMDFIDLGLIPALDNEASRKIENILNLIFSRLKKLKNTQFYELLHLIFRLLAAKLLKDREGIDLDFNKPDSVLEYVSDYYTNDRYKKTSNLDKDTIGITSEEIGNSFSLKNLSVDALTYLYENSFVTKEHRKKLGIHSTPSYLADYILSQINLDEIPINKWKFFDPTCGHGIFLISAIRRMRPILPLDWNTSKRHKFLTSVINGIEVDPFASEVARMCLMLSDFPNKNGWNIITEDCFKDNLIEQSVSDTTFLIGNPPFENFEDKTPKIPKPVELLSRSLPTLPDSAYLGMVLPHSFLNGQYYKKLRSIILNNFNIISITSLPSNVFLFSQQETSVLIAKKTKVNRYLNVNYNIVPKDDLPNFKFNQAIKYKDQVPQYYFINQQQNEFIVPLWRVIWDNLDNYKTLRSITDINVGVRHKKGVLDKAILNKPVKDSVPGIAKVTKGFYQYHLKDIVHIRTSTVLRSSQHPKSWKVDWNRPKIILPSGRTSVSKWKYCAAIDYKGLLISRRFFGVFPTNDKISLELITAIFNSPLAQAYIYSHTLQRNIDIDDYYNIPIPPNLENANLQIKNLVSNYIKYPNPETLLKIDAEILKLYNLPPKLERILLDIFWDQKRKVPFIFKGYIPPEFKSWIPLHIYISDKYKNSTLENLLSNFPQIDDEELLEYLSHINEEI